MKRKKNYLAATIIVVMATTAFKNSEECDKIIMKVDKTATKIELILKGNGIVSVDWGDGNQKNATISSINQIIRHSYGAFDENHTVIIEAPEIRIFTCNGKGIISLDVSKCRRLEQLRCNFVNLKSLNTGDNARLNLIECKNNRLDSLDVSKCSNLESLWCNNNNIKFLYTGSNTQMKTIVCNDNNMDSLDIRGNSQLSILDCQQNNIKSVDISKNIALKGLICDRNNLKSIDISKNTILEFLFCQRNQIEWLDISKNIDLQQVNFQNNLISAKEFNKMFKKMPKNSDKNNRKSINIENNPGTNTCKTKIAEKKGWEIIK